ncbi:SDR family NAD(P)-dependent oxidoreductase [Nocardiopsis composta]|uniref:NAD(P)-dependent dehydrogenase (Short-subunit alcohol dehydrogenase family) n=1 Tax=Nocardiopsis composta TaxID=157465 RepID=A0A7W8QGK3_9ACTN|nr:SDR family NAD(P)-dependent oxidoreductase [Nocardiopsis composta]MBB5429961.1 NAD(P)-dependent dehydrogenase (short-subunit alcohol dehydrogenase family) [Nocardiopsis composta]
MESAARIAVVTGGAGGIGRAVCAVLARAGLQVVALGRDADRLARLERDLGGAGVRGLVCDAADEQQVERVLAGLEAPVEVLVNNAGAAESAPLHRTTLASWNEHFTANATTAFLLTRAVLPGMRERNRGRIVAVASTAGLAGAPYTAAYTAAKHAMVGLVRVTAAELAGTGATCNAVCPAFVRTPMTERSAARIAERTGRSAQEAERALAGAAPLGRLVEPEEVAAAVGYLASEAAGCVNGQTIVLDGGGIQQ